MLMRIHVALVAITLAAAVAAARDDKKPDALDGEWSIVSVEAAGNKVSEDVLKRIKLVVKGDQWTTTMGKKDLPAKTAKLDPSKSPKEVDFVMRGEKAGEEASLKAIYKVDGDTLTVCLPRATTGARPKEFKAGDETQLTVYKRAEKK